MITRGRLKLSTGSVNGNSIILRMAEAGDLVGLPGALNGRPYEATAEVIEPLAAVFIPRLRFLRFLRVQPDASLQVAQVLSELCHVSFQAVRRLVSTRSAPARFASFLLDLAQGAGSGGKLQAKLTLTHGQIGETLGLSRETVTRLATDFKRKGWIAVEGATLQIADAVSLQRLVEQETAASPGV